MQETTQSPIPLRPPAPPVVAGPAEVTPRRKLKKLRLAIVLLVLSILAVMSTIFGMMMAVSDELPSLENVAQFRAARNSAVYSDHGRQEIARLTDAQNRILLTSSEISPNVKNSVVAIEDRRFYQHQGVDFQGIARAVWQADITLTDVHVPVENRLAFSRSFKDTALVLTATRSGVAWEAVGHAIAAYEIALTYAKERIPFDKPLISFQIIQNKLATMLADVTTMQLLCLRLGQLQEEHKMTASMASMAKMNNARLAREVVADAREMLGGNGILLDYHIARHHADIEAVFTYEGTDTIQSLIVGREITGRQAFSPR